MYQPRCAKRLCHLESGEEKRGVQEATRKNEKPSKAAVSSELYALFLPDGVVQRSTDTACLPRKVFHTEADLSTNPRGVNMTAALMSIAQNRFDITPLWESGSLSALRC